LSKASTRIVTKRSLFSSDDRHTQRQTGDEAKIQKFLSEYMAKLAGEKRSLVTILVDALDKLLADARVHLDFLMFDSPGCGLGIRSPRRCRHCCASRRCNSCRDRRRGCMGKQVDVQPDDLAAMVMSAT